MFEKMQQTYEQSLRFNLDIMLLKTPIETLFHDDNSATERSCGKVMFSLVSVLSDHGEGCACLVPGPI